MKISSLVRLALAAGSLGLLAACDTFSRRAEKKADVFYALDEATQQRLKEKNIQVGDTPDMVYIALGVPDSKLQRLNSDGRELIWVYKTYYQDYQGSELIGYRRYFVAVAPNRYVVHFEPVRREIYQARSEENIRVTFVNGHVTTVEQAER
jgi:hypothetical protein